MRLLKLPLVCHQTYILCLLSTFSFAKGKSTYWQQEIKYKMNIQMDVVTNQFKGYQEVRYKNNSPDVIDKLYFHLYFNAFQPGSSMDIRSRTIPDPDPRVGSRIINLSKEEIGFQEIKSITQQGQKLSFRHLGTILEVTPARPILPGQSIELKMDYIAQVPLQIRRSGRDNAEGIRYSMAQWYPKMCEYDRAGWHTDPYIGREFYGVWGDFDVTIIIDSSYTVAATGILKNAKSIPHGFGGKSKTKSRLLTWNWVANDVHDFVWSADPDYIHEIHKCKNGVVFHTFYQDHEQYTRNWKRLPAIMEEAMNFINGKFGTYPYPQYSFIQGGDGGMEYPMATLITGNRPLISLVGVSLHEFLHSWFYGILAFNEHNYYWMDEGFTNYGEIILLEYLKSKGLIPGEVNPYPFEGDFKNYYSIVTRGIEEPLTTHADHFDYNTAYSFAAYTKGALFLHQLEYIIGPDAYRQGFLDFFERWKYKHPEPDDFILVMEKASGMQLDWYKEYMIYSTKTIDYSVDSLHATGNQSGVFIINYGRMPMPIDVKVTLVNGSSHYYTIPLNLMLAPKKQSDLQGKRYTVLEPWDWVNPVYEMTIPFALNTIVSIQLDPDQQMADMDRTNNVLPRAAEEKEE